MEIPKRSNNELEGIAAKFLTEQSQRGRVTDGRAFMVEQVAERLGYWIVAKKGLAEIAEAYIPIRGNRIYIDEQQYRNGSFRFRFTLAEELAHILIHRPLFEGKTVSEIRAIQEDISDAEYKQIEHEAKYLGSCLLMPREDFIARFTHFYALQRQAEQAELPVLRWVIRQLSMDYNVSCYSAALRAKQLHLIDSIQLEELIERFG